MIGTDMKFSIAGRKVVSSDGLISEADRKAGGAALAVYLPNKPAATKLASSKTAKPAAAKPAAAARAPRLAEILAEEGCDRPSLAEFESLCASYLPPAAAT